MQEMPTENDKHSFEGSDPATLFREFAAEWRKATLAETACPHYRTCLRRQGAPMSLR